MIEPGRVKKSDLKDLIAKGEDSRLQFKKDVRNIDALASEMATFCNSDGGRILIGVTDAGELLGIPRTDLGRINQLISNAASQFGEKFGENSEYAEGRTGNDCQGNCRNFIQIHR